MADKTFTDKQREAIARRMGYDGPMQMFDEYLKSSPNDARKFGLITDKFMARGGMIKMAEGGTALPTNYQEARTAFEKQKEADTSAPKRPVLRPVGHSLRTPFSNLSKSLTRISLTSSPLNILSQPAGIGNAFLSANGTLA